MFEWINPSNGISWKYYPILPWEKYLLNGFISLNSSYTIFNSTTQIKKNLSRSSKVPIEITSELECHLKLEAFLTTRLCDEAWLSKKPMINSARLSKDQAFKTALLEGNDYLVSNMHTALCEHACEETTNIYV